MNPSTEEAVNSIFQPESSIADLDSFFKQAENESESEQYIFSLGQLLERQSTPHRYLWGAIMPVMGLAAIAGAPDSGKSMFCRELALSISLGRSEFLGFPLSLRHSRAIYVSTEDSIDTTQFAFTKQLQASADHTASCNRDHLQIVFADQIHTKALLENLFTMLSANPVDLIVLDSYGDLFNGRDGNSNTDVRAFLKPFALLANKFECLLLFIHHLNKAAYSVAPNQRHVQGAGALGQKTRLLLELRKGEAEGIRYLSVLKGNGVSGKLKEKALELQFHEHSLTFTRTGNERPHSDFTLPGSYKPERDCSLLFEDDEEELPYGELLQRYQDQFEVSHSTAKRGIREGLTKGRPGHYRNPRVKGS